MGFLALALGVPVLLLGGGLGLGVLVVFWVIGTLIGPDPGSDN